MKNYKKGLLTLTVLATMSLMAADDRTIYVTTLADEDGENLDKCSLREALKAAETHNPYGGCSAGEIHSTVPNRIQLAEGTYLLNKELVPNSNVIIIGKESADYSRPNVLSNTYPAALPLKTTISGQGKSRIFNTIYGNKPSINLNNIILTDGSSASDTNHNVGGAIYAGGAVTLTNVSILNSKAQSGGAIYLNDIGSALSLQYGVFQGNMADQGSVLAMSCLDNLGLTKRNVDISSASFLNNGSANSSSVFSFCGQPTAIFTANTITNNNANASQGNIIQFSKTTPQGKIDFSDDASLTLLSNTIVKNNAWATLLYGFYGLKALSNNVLAYNAGKSCRYADGDVSKVENSGMVMNYNALTLTAGNDQCEVAEAVTKDKKDNTLDVSTINFSTLLTDLSPATESTNFMPMYFPKDTGTDKDLVDIGFNGCSQTDQRGITRVIAMNSSGKDETTNSCDIGSTEILRLTANNLSANNTSIAAALTAYQKELDTYNKLIADTTTNQDYIPFYKIQADKYSTLVKYTKSDQKYRAIFVDPFVTSLPAEVVSNDTRVVKHLSADNYDVEVKALGVGILDEKTNQFSGKADPNLNCEWNSNLNKVIMWRTKDNVTPSGDNEFCSYQLKLKSNPSIVSSAYIIGSFVNIAPSTEDANVKIAYGSSTGLDLDLLQYANDDGDGSPSNLVDKPNKPKFYVNADGKDLAIRIGTNVDPVVISAERSGPCPGTDSKYTCYGGKVHVQLRNTLDPFSYKFTYYVYDADGAISNASTVNLENSGTAPGSTRVSGGGSMGWLSLIGLVGLAGYRRYKLKK